MIRDVRALLVYADVVRNSQPNANAAADRGPMIDHHAAEREKRAEVYAARVREIESLIGGWGYENSPRERRLEWVLARATIFADASTETT